MVPIYYSITPTEAQPVKSQIQNGKGPLCSQIKSSCSQIHWASWTRWSETVIFVVFFVALRDLFRLDPALIEALGFSLWTICCRTTECCLLLLSTGHYTAVTGTQCTVLKFVKKVGKPSWQVWFHGRSQPGLYKVKLFFSITKGPD